MLISSYPAYIRELRLTFSCFLPLPASDLCQRQSARFHGRCRCIHVEPELQPGALVGCSRSRSARPPANAYQCGRGSDKANHAPQSLGVIGGERAGPWKGTPATRATGQLGQHDGADF